MNLINSPLICLLWHLNWCSLIVAHNYLIRKTGLLILKNPESDPHRIGMFDLILKCAINMKYERELNEKKVGY